MVGDVNGDGRDKGFRVAGGVRGGGGVGMELINLHLYFLPVPLICFVKSTRDTVAVAILHLF